MAERRLGVLLLGGSRTHQENYARAFAADPRCRLVAVADEAEVGPERSSLNGELATQLGIPYIPDLGDALGRSDVDLVSICVEHERRARVAVRCAEAGRHLYLDKPIACSVPGARAIAAAVARAGVRSQMFSLIHTPWARVARRALQDGAVGELRAIHAEVMFAKGHAGTAPPGEPRRQEPFPTRFTFFDSKRELRATGVYSLALIRWLASGPWAPDGHEVRSVFAVTANYFFAEHARNGTEDFGVMSLGLDGGVTATVTAGRIGWHSHPSGGPMRVTLVGTAGTVTIDANRPSVEVHSDAEPWRPPAAIPGDPMAFWRSTQEAAGVKPKPGRRPLHQSDHSEDAARFLDCIEQAHEAEITAEDGAALVETLMAAYVSAARGEPVDPAQIDWSEKE